MRFALVAVLLLSFTGLYAWADTPVTANQGAPGKQGCWPVCGTVHIEFDAGYLGAVSEQPCLTYKETNTSVGTSAVLVPPTPLANRAWVRICNSLQNSEGAQCVCSATTTPTFTASSLGDNLAVSDCVKYPITSADAGVPICICNGASTRLPTAECAYR